MFVIRLLRSLALKFKFGDKMKKLALSVALIVAASTAFAAEVVTDPVTDCRLIPIVGERTGNVLYYNYEDPSCAPVVRDSKPAEMNLPQPERPREVKPCEDYKKDHTQSETR